MEPQVWKLVQKRTYDLLSHRYGVFMVLVGAIVITVSAFHFGEALLEWSHEKYAAVFNSFSDNLAGRSYRERLCLPVPIDVVYTWVNGSDPELVLQVRKVKMSMEEALNISRKIDKQKPGQCSYSNCVPAPVVVVAGLPFTLDSLQAVKVALSINTSQAFNYTALTSAGKVDSLALELSSWEQAKPLDGRKHQQADGNYTLIQAYYTSDTTLPHATVMSDKVLMTGFPHEYSSDHILGALPEEHRKNILKVEVHADKGVAVLHVGGPKAAESILQLKNFTIEGKTPAFTAAYMLSDLTDLSRDGDVSSSRFEDNEELRYSLRSLERFAPWVRQVYIVTNGQIPYWLNLDNPRITLITHQELFPNKSHLPTFSSPAIESHLHRIPGLSSKFLYLNDDVMFGSEVWPDDFFTYATGHKLYLTWPVPSCNEGCPSNWIRDGYCDKACNSSECEWDGGDCTGVNGHVQLGAGFQVAFGQQSQNTEDYCHTGCANNWLADKYCDQACNYLSCGFDAGDCGISSFDQMTGLMLRKETEADQHYAVPEGETLAYFNLTQVLGSGGKVDAASHGPSGTIRAAAVSNKFRVLTLILHPHRNATRRLTFHLKGHRSVEGTKFEVNFTVSVNTSAQSMARMKSVAQNSLNQTEVPGEEEERGIVLFEEYPRDILRPHIGMDSVLRDQWTVQFPFNVSSNLTQLGLSPALHQALAQVWADGVEGDYTEAGLQAALAQLHRRFLPELKAWTPPVQLEPAAPQPGVQLEPAAPQPGAGVQHGAPVNDSHTAQHGAPVNDSHTAQHGAPVNDSHTAQHGAPVNDSHTAQHRAPVNDSHTAQHGAPVNDSHTAQHRAPVNDSHTAQHGAPVNDSHTAQHGAPVNDSHTAQHGAPVNDSHTAQHGAPVNDSHTAQHGAPVNDSHTAQLSLQPAHRGQRKLLAIPNTERSQQEADSLLLTAGQEKTEQSDQDSSVYMRDEDFLKFVKEQGNKEAVGRHDGLPREVHTAFNKLHKQQQALQKSTLYQSDGRRGRRLLDTFGDSLRHVNRLYNRLFGYAARKVPAHMPHMIDKHVMAELQAIFPAEWEVTSSHKVRSPDDMQFAFSYYYYVLGAVEAVLPEQVFEEMDTDHSGILSDRELRTLITRLNELPLYLETLTTMEKALINCSGSLAEDLAQSYSQQLLTLPPEQYYEQQMPQVTRLLFTNCDAIVRQVKDKFKARPKYRSSIMDDSSVAFKMIHGNVSKVVGQLDDIRKNPKKFICLNDNIDHKSEEAKTVKAVVQDFYESLLPVPSQFELPREYRNRFLHADDLAEWKRYRDWLRFWAHMALLVLVLFAIASYFGDKIEALQRRWSRTRTKSDSSSSSELEETDPVPTKTPPLLTV